MSRDFRNVFYVHYGQIVNDVVFCRRRCRNWKNFVNYQRKKWNLLKHLCSKLLILTTS